MSNRNDDYNSVPAAAMAPVPMITFNGKKCHILP
jgi:hypothetical protein